MKKSTLLLLAAVMLVSCSDDTAILPETTVQSSVTLTEADTTSHLIVSDSGVATAPVTTEAPAATTTSVATEEAVTYPSLYEKPEISGTHDDVVPVQTIETIENGTKIYGTIPNLPMEEILADMEKCTYIIALVTPLELNIHEASIRVAIDYVYEEHIPDNEWSTPELAREKIYSEETPVYYSSYMYGYGWHHSVPKLTCYENEIPITTTGGKYVMILELEGFIADGEDGCTAYYHLKPYPLTWELDMDSVPGSTGDNWNRPPFIGYAEDYYAFSFGDVWDRYVAE